MENYSEQRRYERYDHNAYVSLYRYDSQDQYYDANMHNYSKSGMFLKTDEEMIIGQHVYIRDYDKDSNEPEKFKSYSGYIRWSEELGTSHPGGQYGYGIEYMEP